MTSTDIAAPRVLAWSRHALFDLVVLLVIAIVSWWLHRQLRLLPLPTQTFLVGVVFGRLFGVLPALRRHRPAPEVPLTVGMVLLGAQVDVAALQAIGATGCALWLLYQPLVRACVRVPLRHAGVTPAAASLVAVGLGGGSLSAVLAAEASAPQRDAQARQLAVMATLLAGAAGYLLLPDVVAVCGMDATRCARFVGITMATTAEAVLVGAEHSPEAMRATGAMRLLVNLCLWLPVVAHLRSLETNSATPRRRPVAVVCWAMARVPGFVYGLGLMTVLTLLGGLAAAEQQALARVTNWSFLMVLAGVGMSLRWRALRDIGWRPLLAVLVGIAASMAIMLAVVRAVP